jgi:NhaP-type Na+/H+ or K+/H+ antiporter
MQSRVQGPDRAFLVLEAESLLNDASGITLFGIFAPLIYEHAGEVNPVWPSVWSVIPTVVTNILQLSAIGVAIGLATSWVTGRLLRLLRWRGVPPGVETTLVLGMVRYCCLTAMKRDE